MSSRGRPNPRTRRHKAGDVPLVSMPALAYALHAGQKRKDNPETPYVTHPKDVAGILRRYGYPRWLCDAGWGHDLLEDTVLRACRSALALMVPDLRTYNAIVAVTNVYTTGAFPDWNRARRKQAEAQRLAHEIDPHRALKLADLLSNTTNVVNGLGTAFSRVWLEEARDLYDMIAPGITSGLAAAVDAALRREGALL